MGRVFDRYDEASLFDPDTDLYYEPYDGKEQVDGSIRVNGSWYYPFRRYRTGSRLREEVAAYGFTVLHQTGELGQNLVAVHQESEVLLQDPTYSTLRPQSGRDSDR